MTRVSQRVPVASWTEPDGIAPRGTLVVIPGRGTVVPQPPIKKVPAEESATVGAS